MPEEVVHGRSLEKIREEWALKLNLMPEEIDLEVLSKPSLFSQQWKVRLSWKEKSAPVSVKVHTVWDGVKYDLTFEDGIEMFRPYAQSGDVLLNGQAQDKPFRLNMGDEVQFHPIVQKGLLTWDLEVRFAGLSVVANVKHEPAGRYVLPAEFTVSKECNLEKFVSWEDMVPEGESWDEAKLKADLEKLKIVYGVRSEAWSDILEVQGAGEVVIAEATVPLAPEHAKLTDFVGEPQAFSESKSKNVDYFASKVSLVQEGDVLARKIPGKPGIPGKDVFGKELPAAPYKDIQFHLKKNVVLSPDGLEVLASCAGQPVRLDERTYTVENVYVLQKDVDLETGSIEFPGDVFINGNVQDGLRVHAGGKIEIKGSVSHAEIRAEKGAVIHQNLIGGETIVGEKYVFHSELLRGISEFQVRLKDCLQHTSELLNSPKAANLKPGQLLKLLMEKQFSDLPKLVQCFEKLLLDHKDDELVTDSLILSIGTAKRFLVGLGPLEKQALPFLQQLENVLQKFVESLAMEVPEKLSLTVNYVQGAMIQCGGTFECKKEVYNSDIRVEGDVSIEGTCRGGKVIAQGNAKIRELGGSGISATFVQIGTNSRLEVEYCHPNVIVAVGKEIIRIEEPYKQVRIYREKGTVQMEKQRVKPL